jgi:hypothetical protein
MQFGRESDNTAAPSGSVPSAFVAHDDKGWVCSKNPDHFTRAA